MLRTDEDGNAMSVVAGPFELPAAVPAAVRFSAAYRRDFLAHLPYGFRHAEEADR